MHPKKLGDWTATAAVWNDKEIIKFWPGEVTDYYGLGIELDHPGRSPEWFDSRRQELREPYAQVQLENLVRLVNTLRRAIPTIHLASGHDHATSIVSNG